MKSGNKRHIPSVGSLLEIPLPEGRVGYGRVLQSPLMAFYATKLGSNLSPDEIMRSPVAFKVWVMDSALSSKRWRVIAECPLGPEFEYPPAFFRQDAISKLLSIYQNGVERPANRDECIGLERAAVWSPEHIESRLHDFLSGKQNQWVELLALKD